MINIYFLLLNLEEKSGGLFDFDGTLILTIFQFLSLMFILEKILFTPLSNIENTRTQDLTEKTKKAESNLSIANFFANLYNTEISNVEKKIDLLLKKDDVKLRNIFKKQLLELTDNSKNTIIDIEHEINKKINSLSSNLKVKSSSTTIAAIIIDQIISK